MPDLGQLIYHARDDEGEIHVYEDARFRYLTFGNGVEQSCIDLEQPARLEYVYTQAMMLALLLRPDARHALLLGIGGGSLARALCAADRRLRVTGIERRQAVIDTARTCFRLPDHPRFHAVCDDAEAFLARPGLAFDLVFADLYLADGMYPRQTAGDFLAMCQERLATGGVLVLNQWASEYRHNHAALLNLSAVFDERVLNLHVQGGNILSFAIRGPLPDLERNAWFAAAQPLGHRLSIPLQRHARNLWRQNAEVLRVGRFRL